MNDRELHDLLRKTKYPKVEELFVSASDNPSLRLLLVGLLIIDGRSLPHKLREWVMPENLGKVSALGQFIDFVRRKQGDPDFVEKWQLFEGLTYSKRKAVVLEALAHKIEREEGAIRRDTEEIAREAEDNRFPLMKIQNPRQMAFWPSRKLVEMLKEDGDTAACYYLSRYLTSYWSPDDSVTW